MKIKINKLAVEAFMFVIIMTLINFILSRMGFYGEPLKIHMCSMIKSYLQFGQIS